MGPPEVWEMRERGASNERKPMLDTPETALSPNGTEAHLTVPTNRRLSDDDPEMRRSHTDPERSRSHTDPERSRSHTDPARRRSHADPERRRSLHAGADDVDDSQFGSSKNIPWFNHNRYATRKTAAQGMMDVALMLANASQLKSVVQEGPVHPHYTLLLILITSSIILQIGTGLLLLLVGARESNYDDNDEKRNLKTSKLNNFTIFLVFLITVTNIFITSFGINGNTSAVSASGHGTGYLDEYDAVTGDGSVNDATKAT